MRHVHSPCHQQGFESYVFDKLNEVDADGQVHHKLAPDVSWFPCNKAMAITDTRDSKKEQQLSLRLDKLSADAHALLSTANAHLQAVTHSMKKEGHVAEHNVLAPVEEESSDDEEGLLDATLEMGAAAAIEAMATVGDIATVGAHTLGEATDLTAGFIRQSSGEMASQFADEINHLADMGFDNADINLQLLQDFNGNMSEVLRALHGVEEEEVLESRLSMASGAASSMSAEPRHDQDGDGAADGSFAENNTNWI